MSQSCYDIFGRRTQSNIDLYNSLPSVARLKLHCLLILVHKECRYFRGQITGWFALVYADIDVFFS